MFCEWHDNNVIHASDMGNYMLHARGSETLQTFTFRLLRGNNFSDIPTRRYTEEALIEGVIETQKRDCSERPSLKGKLVQRVKNLNACEQSWQDIPETEMESHMFYQFDNLYPDISTHIESDSSEIVKEFRCPDCNMTFEFESVELLASHMITHRDSFTYSCDFCQDKFRTVKSLRMHQKTHGKDKGIVCNLCGYSTSHEKYLKQHLRKHTLSFSCKKCGQNFHLKSQLNSHMVIHVNKTFKCNICGEEYSDRRSVLLHKRQSHPEKCVTCGKLFPNHSKLLLHQPAHTVDKAFTCDKCGCAFRYKQTLYTHKKYAHLDPVQEPINKDEGAKNINQCEICGKTFPYKNSLRVHVNSHTRANTYVCDVCGKSFSNRTHLKFHCKIHTGDRSFTCDVCGKAFMKGWDLKLHQRTHTGERPYKCEVCEKSFTQRSTLTIHKRLHTGERPYKCDVCDHDFVCKALLTVHQKTHKKCTTADTAENI